MSMNSQQPPRYGAEGPPGGPEAWNRQRFGQEQPQGKKGFSGAIQQMLQQRFGQGGPSQGGQPQTMPGQGPVNWSGQGRAQWGQPQGQTPMPGSLGAQMGGGQPPPQMPGGAPQGAPTQQGMRGQMQQFAAQNRNPMGNIGGMLRAATMLRQK